MRKFWPQSLSARRAWIEMLAWYAWDGWQTVALRKESVDRNQEFEPDTLRLLGRSPQGERG